MPPTMSMASNLGPTYFIIMIFIVTITILWIALFK